jgi:uncharacterized protein YfaS (alpha-2-macroglobulin family)
MPCHLLLPLVLLAAVQSASQQTPAPNPQQEAERLFSEKRWMEARNAYDTLENQAVERAVECCLQIEDWDAAIGRAIRFAGTKDPDVFDRSRWHSWNKRAEDARETLEKIARLESSRDIFRRIAERMAARPQQATRDQLYRLVNSRIDVSFKLIDQILGEGFGLTHTWERDNDWWYAARDPLHDEGTEERYDHVGVPLGPDGQPRFVQVPKRYKPDLGPGAKVLFLLKEIAEIDVSPRQHRAAEALLKRALIVRRLYGPIGDPAWDDAAFYYYYDQRPSFQKSYRGGRVKPYWELEDDEARTLVDGQVVVVKLPATESPLALLRQLDRDYPLSTSVPEAMYVRGVIYQSRQQFAKAEVEYQALIKAYPRHKRAKSAREQIPRLHHPAVMLGRTGYYAAGSKPTLWFAHRQTEKVEFTARRLDIGLFLRERLENPSRNFWRYDLDEFLLRHRDDEARIQEKIGKYLGKETIRWTAEVARAERVTTHTIDAPLTDVGAYLVEARAPGSKEASQGVVILTDLVIVQKQLAKQSLVYVAHAQSGKPVADQEVLFFYRRNGVARKSFRTNRDGIIKADNAENDDFALAMSKAGGIATLGFQDWPNSEAEEQALHIITDRPAYRPGDTIFFRAWVRHLRRRSYEPPRPGEKVSITLFGPNGGIVKSLDLTADRWGAVSGSFVLSSEAALGEYVIRVPGENYYSWPGVARVRVEAYKKPEFEVTVEPADRAARLGDRVRFRFVARYYSGEPVRHGRAQYEIFRRDHDLVAPLPQPFDWLYGAGYGQYVYSYPWLTKSQPAPDFDDEWRSYHGLDDSSRGPQIKRGEVELDDQGQAVVSIDTAGWKQTYGDRDHRIHVEAEVRDQSRRTIRGKGEIVVARQIWTAGIELDRNWYAPKSNAKVTVTLVTTDSQAVTAPGLLRLSRITFPPPDHTTPSFETVQTWKLTTDAQGRAAIPMRLGQEGQYRVDFEAADSERGKVTASQVFWVHGPAFDGKAYRLADLEIIPDRRSYQIGDTARLLVHVASPDAHMLYSDDARYHWLENYRFIDISGHAAVIEMRVEPKRVPNFFVEATVVSRGQTHTQSCELFVPPVNDVLDVRIQTDKQTYKPGESGTVTVKVADAAGKPVAGQVTLSVYDKAVSYVQDEIGTKPTELISRRKMEYRRNDYSQYLNPQFEVAGTFLCPEFEIHDDGRPSIALGGAAPSGGDPADTLRLAGSVRLVRGNSSRSKEEDAHAWVEPVIRSNFGDTALWRAALEISADGTITTALPLPQSLTTWRIRAYALTNQTQVGDATAHVTTAKNLVVRLQTPRFLVEGDEAVLSAVVQNSLAIDKTVTEELLLPATLFRAEKGSVEQGQIRLQSQATISSGGVHRFDWPVRAVRDGIATITVKALTDADSDAMQISLPILIHGIPKVEAKSGSFGSERDGSRTLRFTVPDQSVSVATQLEVKISPSAVGPMLDALPFLAGYPYGCTEQTMSRFYPSILTVQVLQKLGTDLEKIATTRRQTSGPRHADRFVASAGGVFDSSELARMVDAGLERLYKFQHKDGGWGWWENDQSDPYMTCYVLTGLRVAEDAGFRLRGEVLDYAFAYLISGSEKQKQQWPDWTAGLGLETQAYIGYVLAIGALEKRSGHEVLNDKEARDAAVRKHLDRLYNGRALLGSYGRALLALALQRKGETERAKTVLRSILELVKHDKEKRLAWVSTPADQRWHWWQSDIETNAWLLRAVIAISPNEKIIPELATYLIQNRPSGHYWQSTRDTALAVAALGEYVLLQKVRSDCRVAVQIDDRPPREFSITRSNFLTSDYSITVGGTDLRSGTHEVKLTKTGPGELHYGYRLQYVTKEALTSPESNGIAIERTYYRVTLDGSQSPVRLTDDVPITVGDTIDVVLAFKADREYEYLAFEDWKPGGCEPTDAQSGMRWIGRHWTNLELWDDRVLFFLPSIRTGEHVLRYRLRAETPGRYQVLPAAGFAMYTPEIRGSTAERRLIVAEHK